MSEEEELPAVGPKAAAAQEESWSSWGASWLHTARTKASETLELVKKDLDEFQDVVGSEAKKVASSTAKLVTESIPDEETKDGEEGSSATVAPRGGTPDGEEAAGKSQMEEVGAFFASASSYVTPYVKTLAETVNKALVIDNTHDEELEIPVTSDLVERHRRGLSVIETDPGTFEKEPEGAPELFDDWLDSFSLEEHGTEISRLLAQSPALRATFARLVPSQLPNATFWARYFYKCHQLELDMARRAALLRRGSLQEREDAELSRLSWGDDDDVLEKEIADLEQEGARSRQSSRPSQPTPTPQDPQEPQDEDAELIDPPQQEEEPSGAPDEPQHAGEATGAVVEEKAEAEAAEEAGERKAETGSNADSWSVCSAALDESPVQPSAPAPADAPANDKPKDKAEDSDDWVDWDE